jgi:hypothetical protein
MESNSNKTIAIVFGVLVLLVLVIFFTANSGGGGGGSGGGSVTGGGSGGGQTTTPTTPSSSPGDEEEKAIQLSGLPTVRDATDEEREQILPLAEKLIENEYPDFQAVTPTVTASEMNGETMLYAYYEGTPFEPSAGVSIENTLIVMLSPDGEVSVALSN